MAAAPQAFAELKHSRAIATRYEKANFWWSHLPALRPSEDSSRVQGMKRTCNLIIHHRTFGLYQDALILSKAIRSAAPDNEVYTLTVSPNALQNSDSPLKLPKELLSLTPFDRLFFLEHAYANPPLLDRDFAQEIFYIPNIEWMFSKDEAVIQSGELDFILFKNVFSREMFVEELGMCSAELRITGWTSIDIGIPDVIADYDQCLHVRGMSMQKQTDKVLEAWAKDAHLPPLTVIMSDGGFIEFPAPLNYSHSATIHIRTIPEADLRIMQNSIGVHICPSRAEGFGHTLNEARAASALLVTTNGPPMNNFVAPRRDGYLIPVRASNIGALRRSQYFDVEAEDLLSTVHEVFALSNSERRRVGELARERYLQERTAFHNSIAELFT